MNRRAIGLTVSIVLAGAVGAHAWVNEATTPNPKKVFPARVSTPASRAQGPHAEKTPVAAAPVAAAQANATVPNAPPVRTAPAATSGVAHPAATASHAAPVTAAPAAEAATHDVAQAHTPPTTHAPASESTAIDVDALWTDLLAGNQRFVAGTPAVHDLVTARAELAKGQHPSTIVLACADSRVAPELVFDRSLGELFVVRTAGNVADPVALGSIEYAVEHLGARLLVVLGHEHCGAVKAAASGAAMPTPNLQAIVDHIAPALDHVRPFAVADQLAELGVAANVHQSASDVSSNSPIIHEALANGTLKLIRAVYRLETGEVVRLAEPVESHAHATIEFEVDPSSTAMELAERK